MKRIAIRFFPVLTAPVLAAGLVMADDGATSAETEPREEPAGRASETVFVRESLPFAPASNTIATKLPVETSWTPANVGVVDLTLISEQNAQVLGDALENVSGLNVQTQNGVVDYFVVRGFDSISSSQVLTDGAPEPEATFYQLYNTERVEVFKGPAGFLYGSNSLAGVVNLVRKQPAPFRFGSAGLEIGSHETFEANFDWNHGSDSGALDFRLNGLFRESDGHRDGRTSEVAALNPSWTWRLGDSSTLNFNLEAAVSDYTPDAGLPLVFGNIADVPRSRSYASPIDFSEQDIVRFQVDYETQLSERLSIRNKAYRRNLDWQTNGTLLNGVFQFRPDGLDVFRTLVLLDDDQEFTGNQFEALIAAETGRLEHKILVGLEIARFADDFSLDAALLPTIDLASPVETFQEPLFSIPGQSILGDSRSDIIAPYLIDQIAVSDRVQLLLGVRFDSIDFEDRITGTKRSDSELSPLLGVVVAPSPAWSLYANFGESFAPPSARVVGDRNPEESQQIELGLRRAFAGGRINATFALYQLERDNIPIPDENGFTQQAGDQRSRGFEAEISADFGRGLRGYFSYAHNDSELTRFKELLVDPFFGSFFVVDHSGNDSPFAPENLANLWLSKRFDNAWAVAGGLRLVDDQFIAEDNAFTLDDYLLLDATASYSLQDWRFSLNLKNLADEDYDTRGFGSFSVIPGQPFSASLSIGYRM